MSLLNGTIDFTDRKILSALLSKGRSTFAELAAQVGLTAPTVHDRVKKLERSGIIEGYTAIINPDALGYEITALVHIVTDARVASAEYEKHLTEISEIQFPVKDPSGGQLAERISRELPRAERAWGGVAVDGAQRAGCRRADEHRVELPAGTLALVAAVALCHYSWRRPAQRGAAGGVGVVFFSGAGLRERQGAA